MVFKKTSLFGFLFKKPTNIKEFMMMLSAYHLLDFSEYLFIECFSSLIMRYHENKADVYAISQATDPQALRLAAQFFIELDSQYIDFFFDGLIGDHINILTKLYMNCLRKILIFRHQRSGQTEDFREWAKKQSKSLALLHFIVDPGHPTYQSRAKLFNQAADALEAKLNIDNSLQ